jgi:hypothetical protein
MDALGMDLLLESMDQFSNGLITNNSLMIQYDTIFQKAMVLAKYACIQTRPIDSGLFM